MNKQPNEASAAATQWADGLIGQLTAQPIVLSVFLLAGLTGLMGKPNHDWTAVELVIAPDSRNGGAHKVDPSQICRFVANNESNARFHHTDGRTAILRRQDYLQEMRRFLLTIYDPKGAQPQSPHQLLVFVSDQACVALLAETLGDISYR